MPSELEIIEAKRVNTEMPAQVNTETGEMTVVREPMFPVGDPYAGASVEPFSREIQDVLTAKIPEEDLDILPTGEVYASQVRYRRILNQAFGVGGWALKPRDALRLDQKDNYMYQKWALYAHGRFISESVGEQEYQENNKRMSYAAAAEGVKSNALTRCCKDLGVASECWDRRFAEDFKARNCIKVWCEDRSGKVKPQWRRKDAAPFWNEKGVVVEKKAPERVEPTIEPLPGDDVDGDPADSFEDAPPPVLLNLNQVNELEDIFSKIASFPADGASDFRAKALQRWSLKSLHDMAQVDFQRRKEILEAQVVIFENFSRVKGKK